MSDLKPCPFCGSDGRLHYSSLHGWHVHCKTCPVKMTGYDYQEVATENWNRRVPIPIKEVKRQPFQIEDTPNMAKQNREAQLETALKTLVEACAYVSPLSGQAPMNTIKEMRLAMKFLDANAAAKELLGME